MSIIVTDWNDPKAPIFITEKNVINTGVKADYEIHWVIKDKNGNIKDEGVENGNYN